MRENAPEKPGVTESVENYEQSAHVRKIRFVQVDGTSVSTDYGFLIWNRYFPDRNQIVLIFTGGTVTLTGVNLSKLHEDFDQHLPRKIICMDQRYNELNDEKLPVVNKIEVSGSPQ